MMKVTAQAVNFKRESAGITRYTERGGFKTALFFLSQTALQEGNRLSHMAGHYKMGGKYE